MRWTSRSIGCWLSWAAVACEQPDFREPALSEREGGAGPVWAQAGAAGWVAVGSAGSGGARRDTGVSSTGGMAPARAGADGGLAGAAALAAGGAAGTGGASGGPGLVGQVVINELLPDEPGSDTAGQHSFVELFGTPNLPLDGVQLVLVNGADGEAYATIALAGALDPQGYWVVGESEVTGVDQVLALNLQNGPDAVWLVTSDGTRLDAAAYGATEREEPLGEGESCGAPPEGSSLGRRSGGDTHDNARDFCAQEPTPGTANPGCTSPDPSDGGRAGSAG